MGIPLMARLVLPYTRRELPAWGRLARLGGVYNDALWQGLSVERLRCKWHRYKVDIDLAFGLDRCAYFSGRYYDLPTQLFVREYLTPGDTFIDVGTNVGMITLLASHMTGPTGRVISFEPNKAVRDRFEGVLESNNVANVTVQPMGLSDADGVLQMWLPGDHHAHASFAHADEQAEPLDEAEVRRGDDVLDLPADARVMLKLDVEGFECRALRGLTRTIERHRPPVITECVEEHLARDGATVGDLFELMHAHGYRAFTLGTRRHGLRYRPWLRLADTPQDLAGTEVAWLHPDTPLGARIG